MRFKFDSRDTYPGIIRSGSVAFTKPASVFTAAVTNISSNESYLIYLEEAGVMRRPAYFDLTYNGTNHVYVVDNILYINMTDLEARTGTIQWRIYNE